MRFKGIIAFVITGIAAISTSVTAFAITTTKTIPYQNLYTFTDQRSVGNMKHTAWYGWTGVTTSADGETGGYNNRYKTASYKEYKDSNRWLVCIYDSGYIGGKSKVVRTDSMRTVSDECVKRHHFSKIHDGANADSSISDSTTTNVYISSSTKYYN